jgi:predicted DNA-binding WGR domain protein
MFQRWENDTRYYLIHVQVDLFGATTLRRVWGGLGSAWGGQMLECVEPQDLARRIDGLANQRRRRGYKQVQ